MRPTPIHPLRGPKVAGRVQVKRDDLLGGGIGSKTRKYEALIPHLKRIGIERVGVITSFYGSNAYAAPLMLQPHFKKVHLIHPESPHLGPSRVSDPRTLVGNALLSSHMVPLSERIWYPSSEMEAKCKLLESIWRAEDSGRSVILPEGLAVKEALRGAVRLGKELVEQAPNAPEIYLDSGTGHTAAGVIFTLHALRHPARVTVVGAFSAQHAPNVAFRACLERWKQDFDDIALEELGTTPPAELPMMWQALYPVVARSFGSAPKAVLKYAHAFAETEDILLHPLYSAKMMMTLEQAPHDEGTIAVLSGGGSVLLDYPKPQND